MIWFSLASAALLCLVQRVASGDTKGEGILEKEVCVVGGGAAGSYTTWELQKRGYDVVLIEPLDDLGGNCEIVDRVGGDYVNAAVILFSQFPEVLSFFEEFEASYSPFIINPQQTNLLYSLSPSFVTPQPPTNPEDQQAIADGLLKYLEVVSQPPYLVNDLPVDVLGFPDFSSLHAETKTALLETWTEFVGKYLEVDAISPVVSSLIQGVGYLRSLPMWQVLVQCPARLVAQLFGTALFLPFVELDDGCQTLYDSVKMALLDNDSTSVRTSTALQWFRRLGNGKVLLKTKDLASGEKTKISCDKMIVAFRPLTIDMDEKLAESFTKEERFYFDDLDYNGYVTSVWNMQPGPSLSPLIQLAGGANQEISFTNLGDGTTVVDDGIVTLTRSSDNSTYPWRVFYQPDSSPITNEEVQAVFDTIKSNIEQIGFIEVENVLFKSHRYFVIPQTPGKLETFYGFMQEINFGPQEQSVYYTGALLSGDATEFVYLYSKRLLGARFPDKN